MGKVHFEVRDFFELELPEDELFDVIYDYTFVARLFTPSPPPNDMRRRFFVAIPPSTRASWGSQMCKLVKPGGFQAPA
jgi:hypothetical protein